MGLPDPLELPTARNQVDGAIPILPPLAPSTKGEFPDATDNDPVWDIGSGKAPLEECVDLVAEGVPHQEL